MLPKSEGRLVGVDSPALLPVNGLDLREYLQDLECSLIQQALDDANGVVACGRKAQHSPHYLGGEDA